MRIRVNGKEIDFAGATVRDLLEHFEIGPRGIVVERNGEIVHREAYDAVSLAEGDAVELVRLVGGG